MVMAFCYYLAVNDLGTQMCDLFDGKTAGKGQRFQAK